ncbi:hypothetical protein CH249_01240 [Rhodococcus sp. 05-2255-3B1]|nr:hypothetical protein CH250_06120 [Rhodococcus sp. 05-2255-3C]OZE15908.1 hypothetical protein CH249_01240 [Rhodococcus sp. 05-2255-3B1]OZE18947.1 hypothetical protein CH255_13265 [Rhodococcus sp. 05-2255-2A2]
MSIGKVNVVTDEPEETRVDIGKLLSSPDLALSAAERERNLLDAIRRVFVEVETKERDLNMLIDAAQRQGVSWRKIGLAQGALSPQAAQQRSARYRRRTQDSDDRAPGGAGT